MEVFRVYLNQCNCNKTSAWLTTKLIVIIDNGFLGEKVLMTTIGDGGWAGGSFFVL